MEHLSTTEYRLEIREFNDPTSESGRAWVVDVLDLRGEVLIESAGVASGLPFAIEEAGREIAHLLADEWNMKGEKL
jgi:hypothetical protein